MLFTEYIIKNHWKASRNVKFSVSLLQNIGIVDPLVPICVQVRLSTYFYASPDPDPTEKLGQVNKTTNVNVNSGTAEVLKHFLKLFSDPDQQAQDTDPDSAKRYSI
jgi:hypothetical protein